MANHEAAAKVDRISDLPDEILSHIFSFLESHQPIRLISLSSRYRYLRRSVPTIDSWDNHHSKRSFEKLIGNALKYHQNLAILQKFRLWCISFLCKESLISNCIDSSTAAISLSTKSGPALVCYSRALRPSDLNDSIIGSNTLNKLRLSSNEIYNSNYVNGLVFWPNLTHLEVKARMYLYDPQALSLLLTHSPNLISLVLEKAKGPNNGEKQLRHEKHYRYVTSHDVAFWSRSFFQDMERTWKDHFRRRCWGIGLSFGFRVVALDPNFRKLSTDHIVSVHLRSKNRAILLDYDGTVMPEVISIVNALSNDTRNTVFVVSGRGRESLSKWFSPCKKLGIAAEHGYFMRWPANDNWEICGQNSEFGWKQIADVMKLYTEATDGSNIETKESVLVWHHRDADLGFGSSQAKEMLDHLESVLANEPVSVKSGQYIVEVKPQIFTTMTERGKQAAFVLCLGDDRSDEMFEIISSAISSGVLSPNTSVFACTLARNLAKPSIDEEECHGLIHGDETGN
ncbi:hypothetical protein F3Y22_tig00111917pilonHSYRG00030 [Hibiscus syriacus]|uniref:F-box domain-containing protein n=1 Tax=Hibiscus syriacus TaxID=106335 RepID=A0A6A2X8R9_HIBSY|nr:hypothetical protein F3Y22_tig00111917pilonHSYRG00030 [Hibiscus syriacus]